jgi:hypothetical protein
MSGRTPFPRLCPPPQTTASVLAALRGPRPASLQARRAGSLSPIDPLVAIQRLFRSANARLSELAVEFGADGTLIPFLCECADDECVDHVAMDVGAYAEIHRDADVWIIRSGHPIAPGGIVESGTGFDIVRRPD